MPGVSLNGVPGIAVNGGNALIGKQVVTGSDAGGVGVVDPTGSISATAVMMGIAAQSNSPTIFTPIVSTRVLVVFSFIPSLNSANGIVFTQLAYGTGNAPTNGAAQTGTLLGTQASNISPVSGGTGGYATLATIVSSLKPGTAYWFDIVLTSDGTHLGKVKKVAYFITEI